MHVTVRQIDPQCKMVDYLTLPQLETIIPPQVIQEVLTECEAWEQREKKLNRQAMCYVLMALALNLVIIEYEAIGSLGNFLTIRIYHLRSMRSTGG